MSCLALKFKISRIYLILCAEQVDRNMTTTESNKDGFVIDKTRSITL